MGPRLKLDVFSKTIIKQLGRFLWPICTSDTYNVLVEPLVHSKAKLKCLSLTEGRTYLSCQNNKNNYKMSSFYIVTVTIKKNFSRIDSLIANNKKMMILISLEHSVAWPHLPLFATTTRWTGTLDRGPKKVPWHKPTKGDSGTVDLRAGTRV